MRTEPVMFHQSSNSVLHIDTRCEAAQLGTWHTFSVASALIAVSNQDLKLCPYCVKVR
jgi:hypothetical protein